MKTAEDYFKELCYRQGRHAHEGGQQVLLRPGFYAGRGMGDIDLPTLLRLRNGIDRLERQGKLPKGALVGYDRMVTTCVLLTGSAFSANLRDYQGSGYSWGPEMEDGAPNSYELDKDPDGEWGSVAMAQFVALMGNRGDVEQDKALTAGLQAQYCRQAGIPLPEGLSDRARHSKGGVTFIHYGPPPVRKPDYDES